MLLYQLLLLPTFDSKSLLECMQKEATHQHKCCRAVQAQHCRQHAVPLSPSAGCFKCTILHICYFPSNLCALPRVCGVRRLQPAVSASSNAAADAAHTAVRARVATGGP